jgi:subtilisin family serine protease
MNMDKLDPRLSVLLSKQRIRRKSVITAEEQEAEPLPEFIGALIKVKDSPDFLTGLGCQLNTVIGSYASVRIPLNKLEEVANHPDVERIETNRGYKPDLDDSIKEIKANTLRNGSPPFSGAGKFTGKGVIVGVIDFGFKYTHKVFRDPADPTKSRILFLMDQSLTPQAGETAPTNALGAAMTGVEYTKANIEAAIAAADPTTVVRHVPDSHGTHVAGIAAGNGAQSGNCHGIYHYVGVAPEADLILVRLSSGSNQLGESNNLIDAIGYIRRKAESLGKPAVVNMSLGDNLGAHDGTSLVEVMIDLEVTIMAPVGFSIVKSAGNQGNDKKHAQGNVAANNAASPLQLKMQVIAPRSTDNDKTIEVDIWYPDAHNLTCTVKPPGNNITGTNNATPGNTATFTENTKGSTVTINSQNAQSNSKKRIFITVNPAANNHNAPGEWVIELVNTTGTQAPFDAWIERDQLAEFTTLETNARTISIPGTSHEVITVGNHLCKGKDKGKIAASSSRGPTIDARTKPDISAPGTDIVSARHDPDAGSCCDCCYDFYTAKTGTSMSAPHVAGAIALMLEKNPGLSNFEIKNHLIATAVKDSFTGNSVNDIFGNGKLDVTAALAAVPAAAPRAVVAAVPIKEPSPQPVSRQPELSPEPFFAEGSPIARFVATPQGKELHLLAMKHYREVRDLVNTNKRVATVWHRNDGPLLAHHVIRCSMLPDAALPAEIEGTSVLSRLENIVAALKEYGSGELQAALDLAMPLAAELPGKSLFQAVEMVEEGSLV